MLKRFLYKIIIFVTLCAQSTAVFAVKAAGILFYRSNDSSIELLLAEQKTNKWGDVGGNIDNKESVQQAAAREAAEELCFILDDENNLRRLKLDQSNVSNQQVYKTETYKKFYDWLKVYTAVKRNAVYSQYVVPWNDTWEFSYEKFKSNKKILKKDSFLEIKSIRWAPLKILSTMNLRHTLIKTLNDKSGPLYSNILPYLSSLPTVSSTFSASNRNKALFVSFAAFIMGAVLTYIGKKRYQSRKNKIMKEYGLPKLTPFEKSVWKATALAAMGIPWYLYYLVKLHKKSLEQLIGLNKEALAHFYYGYRPTKNEVELFYKKFSLSRYIEL